MTTDAWGVKPAGEVRPGDRVRLRSGTEMTVTRVERPFLGQQHLVCFIEDTETRWLAMPVPLSAEVTARLP